MWDYRSDDDKERDAEHAALVAEHADIVIPKQRVINRRFELVPLSAYGADVNCNYN